MTTFSKLACAALLLLLSSPGCAADAIYYSSPLFGGSGGALHPYSNRLEFDLKHNRLVRGDDWTDLKVCGNRDAWLCIESSMMFNFHFKRSWKEIPESWVKNGVTYRYYGEEEISLAGVRYQVSLICSGSKQSNALSATFDSCFHFSRTTGIVAIYIYREGFSVGQPESFFTTQANGVLFGAAAP
jgi:hypothetical protein